MIDKDLSFLQVSGLSYACFFDEDHNAIQNMDAYHLIVISNTLFSVP